MSNVQLVISGTGANAVITRVAHKRVEVTAARADGTEYSDQGVARRIARKTGEEI